MARLGPKVVRRLAGEGALQPSRMALHHLSGGGRLADAGRTEQPKHWVVWIVEPCVDLSDRRELLPR